MANTDALTPLIDIARSACDEAARKMGNAQRLVAQAETKRGLLAGYWSEYQTRQRSIYKADAPRMANFHEFLSKLKATMDAHEADMETLRGHLADARKEWELAQRRLKSLENLSGRRLAQARAGMNRAQQKLQDEISAQRVMRGMSQAG
jgi:flagellar export protein FliJ